MFNNPAQVWAGLHIDQARHLAAFPWTATRHREDRSLALSGFIELSYLISHLFSENAELIFYNNNNFSETWHRADRAAFISLESFNHLLNGLYNIKYNYI